MNKRKVLVTGANGFIGRNIFERLSARDDLEVVGTYFTREPHCRQLVWVDLRNRGAAREIVRGCDVVIHAAAVSSGYKDIIGQPQIHVTDNIIMNTSLLDAVYAASVPRCLVMSCTVMYAMDARMPLNERAVDLNAIHPMYRAGATVKMCAEQLCEFYAEPPLGKTRFCVLRHSNIYGPHDKFHERGHVIGSTIARVMQAKEGDVISFSTTGRDMRDVLYISDLLDFVERIIIAQHNLLPYEVVNVGWGRSFTINHIVHEIARACQKQVQFVFHPEHPVVTQLTLDCAQAARRYRWKPTVSLEEGLQKTVAWYREQHMPRT